MPGPNEYEMHPTKVFIRQCENLANSWKAGYSELYVRKLTFGINLEKAGKCVHQNSLASE